MTHLSQQSVSDDKSLRDWQRLNHDFALMNCMRQE
jgi:hypothetical protein